MKKLCVLTGAGISAESGLKTFRDSGGLWENHRVEDVATPEAWARDPALVLEFYNQRRRQLKNARPNEAHQNLVKLEEKYRTIIITQNVDNLHERAGSNDIIHLHGELTKSRSSMDDRLVFDCEGDIRLGDLCPKGSQLRPHIVWFGEMVPMLEVAAKEMLDADIVLIIGTSMQVYPAAGLVSYAPAESTIYYIDPNPNISYELSFRKNLNVFSVGAGEGTKRLLKEIM